MLHIILKKNGQINLFSLFKHLQCFEPSSSLNTDFSPKFLPYFRDFNQKCNQVILDYVTVN